QVPLKQKRLILMGVRKDLYNKCKFEWPKKRSRKVTLKDALQGGYMFNVDVPSSEGAKFSKVIQSMITEIPPGKRGRDLPIELQQMHGDIFRNMRRLSWFEPSPMPYHHRLFPVSHPEEDRPLQIREVARIFTFPDCWYFTGSTYQVYKQITKSFPSHLSYLLGLSIIDFLRQTESDIKRTDVLFEGRNIFKTSIPVCELKPNTLDDYIYDGLRMLAKNKDNYVRHDGRIHKENKINRNLSGCLTRFEVNCFTEVEGNGRCDLLLNGKVGRETLSAIIECKRILGNDSDIELGKKLSSALHQIDSYGEIRSDHSKYIVLYIFDRSVDDIHKLFEKLRCSDDSLTFSRVQSKGNSYSVYHFRGKKIVVRTLRTTSPSEVFEKSELTQQIHNALKYYDTPNHHLKS
ncbi:MAG: DNA cytosine methyltransferase, partial [Vibrio metschnikovii]